MFRAFVNEGQTEATAEPKLNGRVLAVVGAAVVLIAVIAAIARLLSLTKVQVPVVSVFADP